MAKNMFSNIWEARAEHKRRERARRKARKTELDNRVKAVSHLPVDEALAKVDPKACAHCGVIPESPRDIHLHHPNGYGDGSEHEVIPLCNSCHRREHARLKAVRHGR